MKTIPAKHFPEIPERDLRRDSEAAAWLASRIDEHEDFERLSQRPTSSVWFRYVPHGCASAEVDALNLMLLQSVNEGGEIRLADGMLDGRLALRLAIAGHSMRGEHVRNAWQTLAEVAQRIASSRATEC